MTSFFDPSLGLPKRYHINDVAEMQILRKIDLVAPSDSTITFLLEEMEAFKVPFEDSLTAIPLTEFIPFGIVDNPAEYMYDLIAGDGFTRAISYEQVQMAYYVIERDRILYNDPDMHSELKIWYLNRISIFNPLD